MVFHVLNRANAHGEIFASNHDYREFERVLAETCLRVPMRILAYCIMPNHWHMVLRPRAERWPWSSLWLRGHAGAGELDDKPPLWPWPVPCPTDWLAMVNQPMTAAELEALRTSANRGRPFGAALWQRRTARRLGLESTFRPRGRPKKRTPTKTT